MNAKRFKGMKVLDDQGVQIGKVSDLGIDCNKFMIKNLLVSTGGFFSKNYFTVDIEQIGKIDNHLHLKSSKVDQNHAVSFNELERDAPEDYFFRNFQYRVVQNLDSNFFGLIDDIKLDLSDNLTFNIIIKESTDWFGGSSFTASLKDFDEVDVLMVLNLGKNQIKERMKGNGFIII